MAAILGDDSGSRMYWEFLDTGLAESAGMGSYDYQGSGAIMSYLCCAPEQAQDNLQRLRELQLQVAAEGVTQKELDLAKRKIASRIVLESERNGTRMFSVGSQWLCEQKFRTVAEIAEKYESMTLAQVNEAIEAFPLASNMTVVVGPRDDLQGN